MKKLLIATAFLITVSLSAQDIIYVISQYQVPRKDMSSFLELYDNYYGDIEFKSGGVVIDWIRIGNGDFNVRVGRYGDMNNWGIKTEMSKFEGPNFWTRTSQHITKYGPRYAGASAYRQGDGSKHNTRQKWNLKVENPQQFVKAFKTFLNDNKKVFGDRWISLSAYTVGNPGGATHSVTMSGESWMELEKVRAQVFANGTAEKFLNSRGKVEDVNNTLHRRMRHYNNERNKAKTYDDMW